MDKEIKKDASATQGADTTKKTNPATSEAKLEAPKAPEPKVDEPKIEFSMKDLKLGDKVSFYPTGAKEPKTIIVDKEFLALNLNEEIIKKHKYAKA